MTTAKPASSLSFDMLHSSGSFQTKPGAEVTFMSDIRKQIYTVIDGPVDALPTSRAYNYVMIVAIVFSMLPLAFKETNPVINVVDMVCAIIFIVDYILRWVTADYKFEKHSIVSFIRYPFTLMATIDLVSILPSLLMLNDGFKALRVLRLVRSLRVLKLARYTKSFQIMGQVLRNSKKPLIAVVCLAVGYVLVAALVVFSVEPGSFDTFFDAVYWAVVSLTTVGYGDIYPVTLPGRIITIISAVFGIAVVALPAGIITAGYMNALNNIDHDKVEELNQDKE